VQSQIKGKVDAPGWRQVLKKAGKTRGGELLCLAARNKSLTTQKKAPDNDSARGGKAFGDGKTSAW